MLIGQQIGPFEIEKELGSGAMGTVYRAKFHRSQEKVIPIALKVVALGLVGNESAMARFEREANILKQLRHPHIVRLIAHGKINKQNPYIAMEYIDGEALDRVLARRGKLGWEEVVGYGKQLAEALQYAHDKGIIHRDLKPSNLMITREGVLKLTDFGIAKDTDVTALTNANSTIGTAAYMSPEQCRGDRNLTNKSDLYSLGVVFFELLTGRKPFVAETTVEMFLKHVNERAPRIGKLVNELPPKFESLILQLLEKDKENRPIDAAWVARLLQEVEEDSFARKSAGLAAAQVRTAKPLNQSGEKMDATDKEAARALRGKKKKAKKKAAVPLLEQKWLRAVGTFAVLAALGGGVYLAVRPSSPDKMFAAFEKADTFDAKYEAATRFLETYGSRGGEMVDKAAVVFREGKVREREKQLTNRHNSTLKTMSQPTENDDPAAYEAAWQAMDAEKDGLLDLAEAQWGKVKARFPDEAKLPFSTSDAELTKARWGWLADKRIGDLAAARAESVLLWKKIEDSRLNELPLKTDPASPESLAIRAVRLKTFGDDDKARSVCEALVGLTERDSDKRAWYLIGNQIRRSLTKVAADPVDARLQRLDRWLDDVKKKADEVKGDPDRGAERRDVRNRCRDVIELYDDDPLPGVQVEVKRAEEIAASVPRRKS
ncbi:serine/threonine protein kinase [Frigoriglobus tundricola]|uniref:non-specific serine/threonine protein kinase n=1 Tax=Frigoriglobus tundricola TaxID=2774151 RepID=A0A6M5Z6E2_9BACT|nr:serine/threonine-protein kinase [Frigoriglobus tundricola]QJX00803.1 Serine/threonine protein kinase [Frigoriglobus tundricola]